MTPLQTRGIVRPDGNLIIPVGRDDAGREYLIALTPLQAPTAGTKDVLAALDAAEGSMPDWNFVEPSDPPPEANYDDITPRNRPRR